MKNHKFLETIQRTRVLNVGFWLTSEVPGVPIEVRSSPSSGHSPADGTAHRNRTNAGLELAFRQIPVANNSPLVRLIRQIGVPLLTQCILLPKYYTL